MAIAVGFIRRVLSFAVDDPPARAQRAGGCVATRLLTGSRKWQRCGLLLLLSAWNIAMAPNSGDGPWYPAIQAKLTNLAEGLPEPPAWYEQWRQLKSESTNEERLRVYQAIRDAGVLPADAGFYLVAWHIDAMSSLAAERELRHLDERMLAIEQEHGLAEDEIWLPEEAPAEYEQLRQQYQAARDDIFLRLLDHHGEREAAALFRSDYEEFERRLEAGRTYFYGPTLEDDTPQWLEDFIAIVVGQITADSPMGPIKSKHRAEAGSWEVVVHPASVELVGGAQDGGIVYPAFSLDLEGLRGAFAEVVAAGWHALGLPPEEGPEVFVEGTVAGRDVYLRVLACAPDDEEPGMKLGVRG